MAISRQSVNLWRYLALAWLIKSYGFLSKTEESRLGEKALLNLVWFHRYQRHDDYRGNIHDPKCPVRITATNEADKLRS